MKIYPEKSSVLARAAFEHSRPQSCLPAEPELPRWSEVRADRAGPITRQPADSTDTPNSARSIRFPLPAGFENNWIPSVPGRAWFPYFRLYGPTDAHFDRRWILPNIEKVK